MCALRSASLAATFCASSSAFSSSLSVVRIISPGAMVKKWRSLSIVESIARRRAGPFAVP